MQWSLTQEWQSILKPDAAFWQRVRRDSAESSGPFVLICSSVGSHGPVLTHDSLLAAALTLRGARVEMLLCDGALPACEACSWYKMPAPQLLADGPQADMCTACHGQGNQVYQTLGLPVHPYSRYLTPDDKRQASRIAASVPDDALKSFCLNGIPVGDEAHAGAIRYYFAGNVMQEPDAPAVLRRFLEGAILTQWVTERLLTDLKPDVLVFHHGIYVPQGVIGHVARRMGIRVVNWSVGYRNKTFVYSHGDTYHRTMIDEPVEGWKPVPLSQRQEALLMEYLDSRLAGNQDWVKIYNEGGRSAMQDPKAIRATLGLDERPVIMLLTNVTWDAQLYYKNNAFPSLLDWLEATIRYFAGRPDLQLVIRVHPSEFQRSSRERVLEVMRQRRVDFPENVITVDGEQKISTYALSELSDCAIIFGTKTGVELTSRGVPVIVAGEAWIRNKGITLDVSTEADYRALLDRLPLQRRLPEETVVLARRYAYHYFFRRLIPIASFKIRESKVRPAKRKSWLRWVHKLRRQRRLETDSKRFVFVDSSFFLGIRRVRDLLPGRDPGLDIICWGILTGSEFIYDPFKPSGTATTCPGIRLEKA
jgi:hypothetical protein